MKIVVPKEKHKNILFKEQNGTCEYEEDGKVYSCIIVSISTNGTYILETIEDFNENRNI